MAIKATLRKKPILGNKESLYLDLYPPIVNQKTGSFSRREFLNLFLNSEIEYQEEWYISKKTNTEQRKIVPILSEKGKAKYRRLTVLEKQHNKNTWDLAEQIRQRRENELNKPLIYSDLEKEKLKSNESGKGNFVDYFKMLADSKNENAKRNWYIVYNYLKDYTNGHLSFKSIDEKWCEDFRLHILGLKSYDSNNKIKQNSAAAYWMKVKTALKQAYKDKIIQINLSACISPIKIEETQKNFLTYDEIERLKKAECPWPMLKKAFLFAISTGMRYSDIIALTWRNIEVIDNKPAIRFIQQKTHGVETHWISKNTYESLGEVGNPDERLFPGFHLTSTNSRYMDRWMGNAQISKHITFHCARHTYANLHINASTDIYTLSRLLGHRSLASTQIYARVSDKSRQDAADRLKLDF
jgi:integrase